MVNITEALSCCGGAGGGDGGAYGRHNRAIGTAHSAAGSSIFIMLVVVLIIGGGAVRFELTRWQALCRPVSTLDYAPFWLGIIHQVTGSSKIRWD